MANRIAGITVEIGGDTTKLSTALKSVNSEIKSTQSELRDVNKLLKLDPGNTELLAQKHRLLRDAIGETKEKLVALKTAAEQANEKLKNGEITQSQYDALQREIVETEQKLKSLEDQASKSQVAIQKIAQAGEGLKNLGGNISSAGSTLTRNVTMPVLALGGAAVKTAADFDESMSQVAAVSGATGDEFEALRDKAREMGSKTKFSASEAADAMNYMAMAGWKTSDMLSGIEGIMNLAAASGEDLATTSDIVTDALTAFGLSAGDSGHFADILAAASSNANTNVSMMGETFKYVAPIAGAMGYSAEDTAEAIGLMANAGIKSSQAGTSLRKMLTELNGEVKIHGEKLGDVTIQTANADGSMRSLNAILADCRGAFSQLSESEKASAAETLVGKTAMSGFLAIMNAAPADIQKLEAAINTCSDSIDGYNGTAEKMAAVMQDNLSGQLTILKSQLQELAISVAEIVMPAIRDIVSVIQDWVDKFNSLDSGTKEMIVKIALIAAAIGPLLVVIGHVITAIGTIMTIIPAIASGISAVTGAFGALSAVLLANPIALVIAAIVALIAIFAALWTKCEGFREFWIGLWNGICDIASKAWDAIKHGAEALGKALSDAWNGIKSAAIDAWNHIKDGIHGAWEGIKSGVSGAIDHLAKGVKDGWNSIKENTASLWGKIKDGVVNIAGEMHTRFTDTIGKVASAFTQKLVDMKDAAGRGLQNIGSAIGSGLTKVKDLAVTGFSNIIKGVTSAFSGLVSGIKDMLGKIGGFFVDLAKNAFSWGADIIKNLISGIGSMISGLVDKVKGIAGMIADFLGFSEPKKGPLSRFHTFMPDMIDLMKEGITGNVDKLKGPMADLASAMIPGQIGVPKMTAQPATQTSSNAPVDLGVLTETVMKYLPRMANQQIYLDSGALVGELADGMNRQLGKAYL